MKHKVLAVLGFTLLLATLAGAQQLEVRVDHPDALYKAGQTVTFSVSLLGADPAELPAAGFVVKKGGYREVTRGTVSLSNGTSRPR